jgi:hypothetical protein
MPAFSDPPYPSNCLVMAFAATFEHYQCLSVAYTMDGGGNGYMPAFSDPPCPSDSALRGSASTSDSERHPFVGVSGMAHFLVPRHLLIERKGSMLLHIP